MSHRANHYFLLLCVLFVVALELTRAQSTESSSTDLQISSAVGPTGDIRQKQARMLSEIVSLRNNVRLHPDSAKDNLALGAALYGIGEKQAADTTFDHALQLDPKLADAWFQKGLIESDDGKLSQALEYFRRALALSPDHVAAHLEAGEMLLRLGDFEQATQELSSVLRLDPGNYGAHYGMGLIRLQTGDSAGAEAEFRRALDLKNNFAPTREYLGVTLAREHKWAEAKRVLEQVLADSPRSLAAANAYATTLASLGDKGRATEEFRRVRELLRQELALNRAQGETNRGLNLWHAGKLPEAAAAFHVAIEAKADYADAHNDLGGVLWEMNDPAGALEEFQAAVRCRPDFADAHNNWGSVLVHSGDLDRAIEQFSAAIEYRPAFALARYNLAKALATKQDASQAEAELRRTITLDPGIAGAHIQLGLLLASKTQTLSPDAEAEFKEGLRLDSRLRTLIPAGYLRDLH